MYFFYSTLSQSLSNFISRGLHKWKYLNTIVHAWFLKWTPPPPPCSKMLLSSVMNNLLLTEREGRSGEYWPEVVAVRTERSEVRTKTTEGQYSPVRLEQARLVSSLLYGTLVMLVSKLLAFENKKYTSYDHFHGNGPYGKIPTKKEPIRTPGFTPRLPCHIII